MRSFALPLVSTLAFAALSWAAPVAQRDIAVGAAVGVGLGDRSLVNTEVPGLKRVDTTSTLSGILSVLVGDLEPVTKQLQAITAKEATVEHLTPLVNQITVIIGDATSSCKGLVGRPVSEILATVDGVLDVVGLAKLLADVLNLVLTAVGVVLALVADISVRDLLCTILTSLACLLQEVLSLVGGTLFGLVGCLLSLIGGVLPCILELKVTILLNVLGL